jgi:pimeloyl-ACP methyl ester carboxylesterase
MNEQAVQFGSGEASLVGIITSPAAEVSADRPAVIFLNSGILHRVGPNRLHVRIARELAVAGALSMRIDLSGIGDSPPGSGSATIGERWALETQAAMDHLQATYGARRFILIGNCSGAAVALLTADRDERVVGSVLINLQGPRTYLRYYFKLAFSSGTLWRRLLSGKARYRDPLRAIRGFLGSMRKQDRTQAPEQDFDLNGLLENVLGRRSRLFFVFCAWDPGLDHFNIAVRPRLGDLGDDRLVDIEIIPGMNHNFSLLEGQHHLQRVVRSWTDGLT